MLSGMLDSENMSQILRGISQKRQNGDLELNFSGHIVQIMFSGGKIVDVIEPPHRSTASIVGILIKAEIVDEGFDASEARNYSELFLELNNRPEQNVLIDEEVYRRVVKHRVLDVLYALDFRDPAIYNFKMHMPEYDRHFAPSISVSQLLLDRVALETDSVRFVKLFPAGSLVRRTDRGGDAFSEEEQIILQLLKEPLVLEKVAALSMLSAYHFQSALLSLYDRAAIEVEQEAGLDDDEVGVDYVLSDDAMGALESSTERPYIAMDQLQVKSDEIGINIPSHEAVKEEKPAEKSKEEIASDDTQDEVPEDEGILEDGLHAIRVNRLFLINSRLLQSNFIPNGLTIIFVAASIYAAFHWWAPVLGKF